jgi:ribonuclease Z
MKITFLGTSSGVPTKERNVSSILLSLDSGDVYMYDCGEGTQHQLTKSSAKPGKINNIFITHLHGDHVRKINKYLTASALDYQVFCVLCQETIHQQEQKSICTDP